MSEGRHLVEVVDAAGVRRVEIVGKVVVGREGADLNIDDPLVSRRHLVLDATGPVLVASDDGSANGSFQDGERLQAATQLVVGDSIRIGASTIQVLAAPLATVDVVPATAPVAMQRNDAVEVRAVPGSYGARIAANFAASAKRARKALSGFGSEPWGRVPVLNLVGPYHDDAGTLIASGSVVDSTRGEAWIIATPEAPPESPHRVLAMMFGDAFPAASELNVLIEGYGLHVSEVPTPTERLAGKVLPAFDDADDEMRGAMAVSFVRFLLKREGDSGLRRLLGTESGRLDETAREIYGPSLGQLEQRWRREARAGAPEVKTGEFIRLSLRHLRPYRRRQAEIFAYMLLSLAFTAAFPFVTKYLFDSALPSGKFANVLNLLIVLGGCFVVSLLAGVRQAYQTAWVSGAVTRDIRQSIFDRVQVLPTAWFSDHPQGDVLSRLFSDVGAVQNGLSQAIGQGVFQALSLVVSASIMLTINLWLGLGVLIAAPLVGFVYRRMAAGAQARSLAVQENNSGLLSVAAESYRANAVVKAFALAGREQRRFRQQGDRLFRSSRRLTLWGGLFGLSVNLIVTLLRLGVLGVGAWLILQGHFTTGGLVAFLSIMGEVLSPVTVLVTLSQDVQASMGSLLRIDEVTNAATEPIGTGAPQLAPLTREVRLRAVGLSYTPERRALDGFDVTIRAGTRVAFVGASGSGKSTVLRLLMRLYEPDEGSIEVDGVDLRDVTLESWRDQLGVVFQDSFLFDATLRENIAMGRAGATDSEIDAAASAAEIDTFLDKLPKGWQTLVGEGGGNLSGGQRQRVAIARALVRNPRLLLLDEATSALDPATERQINQTIERVSVGRTVVAVTHRLASITDFDEIVVVVDGTVAERGRHDDLLRDRGEYARLWAEQTGTPQPEDEPFDVVEALRSVSFLADAGETALTELASLLVASPLEPGQSIDGDAGLVLVAAGRGEVIAVGPGGAELLAAELRRGDAFGVASLLGAASPTSLRAVTVMQLLILDAGGIEAFAASHPAVAASMKQPTAPPTSATSIRLGRMTLARPAALVTARG
jgi:ABC-type multidrug transport system fused ATPase/permease subunit